MGLGGCSRCGRSRARTERHEPVECNCNSKYWARIARLLQPLRSFAMTQKLRSRRNVSLRGDRSSADDAISTRPHGRNEIASAAPRLRNDSSSVSLRGGGFCRRSNLDTRGAVEWRCDEIASAALRPGNDKKPRRPRSARAALHHHTHGPGRKSGQVVVLSVSAPAVSAPDKSASLKSAPRSLAWRKSA